MKKGDFWIYLDKNIVLLKNGNEEVYFSIYEIREKNEGDFKIFCILLRIL